MKKPIIFFTIIAVIVITISMVIFQQVKNMSIDSDHYYDNDLIRHKNLKVFMVESSDFPYLYLDYYENKGLLKKYYLKNSLDNGITINKNFSLNKKIIADGFFVEKNNEVKSIKSIEIEIKNIINFSSEKNMYIINSKSGPFRIYFNGNRDFTYNGGFKNPYLITLMKKNNYLLLYVYEYSNNEIFNVYKKSLK